MSLATWLFPLPGSPLIMMTIWGTTKVVIEMVPVMSRQHVCDMLSHREPAVIRTLSGREDLPGGLRRSSTFLISGFFSTRWGAGCGGGSDGEGPGPRSSG